MVKRIVKVIKVDSSEVAEAISASYITGCIEDEIKEYLERCYETLNSGDVDSILNDSEWWNDLLVDLIKRLKD